MSEIIVKEIMSLSKNNIYVASCIVVTGKILPDEEWYLKTNPKLKITFKSPVITKTINKEKYLIDFTIDKPHFDVSIFNKPTTWVKI